MTPNSLQALLLTLITCLPLPLFAGESALYSGEISAVQNAAFFERYEGRDVSLLEINSGGGEVEAGIQLGLWVHNKGIDVLVNGVCLSSCANYVFTAGRHKRLSAGSVVAWHGNYHHLEKTGLWRDDVSLRMRRDGESRAMATRQVRAQVDKLVAMEKDFFTRVGVDEYLCWVGKLVPHNTPDFYTLSADDMARFGLSKVSLPGDYAATDFANMDWDIRFIRLP